VAQRAAAQRLLPKSPWRQAAAAAMAVVAAGVQPPQTQALAAPARSVVSGPAQAAPERPAHAASEACRQAHRSGDRKSIKCGLSIAHLEARHSSRQRQSACCLCIQPPHPHPPRWLQEDVGA
jgi:hypothetical protein